MPQNPPPEFRAEAVRVALTSGLPRKQVAADFGAGFSTLSRWIKQDRRNPEKPVAQSDLKREVAIFEYINGFYNPRRRHSALGWKRPLAFERKVA